MVLHGIALAFTIMHHLALHHPAHLALSSTILHHVAPGCTAFTSITIHYH